MALPEVIFVCIHNSGRSQMSEGFMRFLSGGKVIAHSAGSKPGDALNPQAVAAMEEVGIDISKGKPKKIDPAIVERCRYVVTMGCGDACPFFPGVKYIDWQLEDPAGKGLDSVRQIRDQIGAHVMELLATLDVKPISDATAS